MARKSRKNLPQPEQAAASVLLPELEEAKIPAAIYGRLSVEDEETEESMETQIALVQDYINRSSELSYVVHAKMTERLFRKAGLWYTGATGESKMKAQ